MKLSALEQKILMNIQLGVICTDMVDFRRPGHKCDANAPINCLPHYPPLGHWVGMGRDLTKGVIKY